MDLTTVLDKLSSWNTGNAEVIVNVNDGGYYADMHQILNVHAIRGTIIIDAIDTIPKDLAIRLAGRDESKTLTPVDKGELTNPLDLQIGGEHYKHFAIQPTVYCEANNLNACQANMVKYATRLGIKGSKEETIKDANKIKHYVDLWLKINGFLD